MQRSSLRRSSSAGRDECERERGLPVSFIATDHYDQGELIEAVDTLNEERTR